MWDTLGFKASPYDTRPLRPIPEDVDLLVGRSNEAVAFATTLDANPEGVLVLSGGPGVGKTSFLNIQQYLLSTGKSDFGPRLLPALQLCSIYPQDEPKHIALRALTSLVVSAEMYCSSEKLKMPPQTKKLSKWVKSTGSSGFEIGIQLFGFGGNIGRQTTLPSVGDASFESLRDAISVVTFEVVNELHMDGSLLVLDNIENLEQSQLVQVLLTFRDTLFLVPYVWWVLIGQRGLGSLIQTLDPRIADRLSGSGLELAPLSFDEIEAAISLRVRRFNLASAAKSPLPAAIHRELYDASNGEIRFIFKYGSAICTKFVEEIRHIIQTKGRIKKFAEAISTEVAKSMINQQIPENSARSNLKEIVKQEIDGIGLKQKDRDILRKLYQNKEARASDFRDYGLKTIQAFSSNFLSAFYQQHLLSRRQEGSAVYYSLRGMAALAAKYDLL